MTFNNWKCKQSPKRQTELKVIQTLFLSLSISHSLPWLWNPNSYFLWARKPCLLKKNPLRPSNKIPWGRKTWGENFWFPNDPWNIWMYNLRRWCFTFILRQSLIYWKCNWPMTTYFRRSVGQDFQYGREVTLLRSNRSTCLDTWPLKGEFTNF